MDDAKLEEAVKECRDGHLKGFTDHALEHFCRDALHVMSFALFGVLCRQGLAELFGHKVWNASPPPMFPELCANMLGSFVMGIAVKGHIKFVKHSAPSVHTAVTTGFCGSFTTFSSWMVHVGELFVKGEVVLALGTLTVGAVLPIGAFYFGCHFFAFCEFCVLRCREKPEENCHSSNAEIPTLKNKLSQIGRNLSKIDKDICDEETAVQSPEKDLEHVRKNVAVLRSIVSQILLTSESRRNESDSPRKTTRKVSASISQRCHNDVLLVIISLIFALVLTSLIAAVFLDSNKIRVQTYWLPAAVGPPGAFCRWQFSRLNRKTGKCTDRIPVGTLMSNLIGTIIAAILTGISLKNHGLYSGIDICISVVAGFCGCLTTVSTFVAELQVLPLDWSYCYCVLSVSSGALLATVLYGAFVW